MVGLADDWARRREVKMRRNDMLGKSGSFIDEKGSGSICFVIVGSNVSSKGRRMVRTVMMAPMNALDLHILSLLSA